MSPSCCRRASKAPSPISRASRRSPSPGRPAERLTQPRWNGKSLSGKEFLVQHVIPNFYFHVTTTYAILRHNGVPVGKRNDLGDMPDREAAMAASVFQGKRHDKAG